MVVTGQEVASVYLQFWWFFDGAVALIMFAALAKYGAMIAFGHKPEEGYRDIHDRASLHASTSLAMGLAIALTIGFVMWEIQTGWKLINIWPFMPLIIGITVALAVYRKRRPESVR